jgi:hypothetical protein
MSEVIKRVVGIDDVMKAVQIREGGGSWSQVIEATGFNGATLRPHIVKFLQSKERLNRPAVERGDRVDSPYAVVQSVELTEESIVSARKRGMAWYSIAQALGVSEAKVRALGGAEAAGRVYVKSDAKTKADAEAAAIEAAKKAKRQESARKAAATRAAKKAAKAAEEAAANAA